MKILIADDNPEVRHLIRRFIRDIADEIAECADGEEVLTAYESFLPDWVLLDIEIKKLDGFEAAKQIKKLYPDAAIIFLTSFDDANLRTVAQELGAKGFVLKEKLSMLPEIIYANRKQKSDT